MGSILIVDDEISARKPLKLIIRELRFEHIFEATDGKEAFEKYKESEPDVVLMDVIMPNMNGLQSTKKILDYDPNAKIIVLTAADQKKVKDDFKEIGVDEYITKPYDTERVKQTIEDMYDG